MSAKRWQEVSGDWFRMDVHVQPETKDMKQSPDTDEDPTPQTAEGRGTLQLRKPATGSLHLARCVILAL